MGASPPVSRVFTRLLGHRTARGLLIYPRDTKADTVPAMLLVALFAIGVSIYDRARLDRQVGRARIAVYFLYFR